LERKKIKNKIKKNLKKLLLFILHGVL